MSPLCIRNAVDLQGFGGYTHKFTNNTGSIGDSVYFFICYQMISVYQHLLHFVKPLDIASSRVTSVGLIMLLQEGLL